MQTGGGFLTGRKGATEEDRENCYGRATVPLTRAIHLTYILSPIDMAGLPGMAQVLAVYHTGFTTLEKRVIQDHQKMFIPTDAAAIWDWSLHTLFLAQDRPPLALAILAGKDAERKYRRYRLLVARLDRLRLSMKAANSFNRLPPGQSAFYPTSATTEYVYGYAADEYRSPLWLCAVCEGHNVLIHRTRGYRIGFARAIQEHQIKVLAGIHLFDAWQLRPCYSELPDPSSLPERQPGQGLEGANDAPPDAPIDADVTSVESEPDHISDAGDGHTGNH